MTIKGVLVDLSGTLHLGAEPLPGALDAVKKLYRSGLPLRFVTNTSRMSRRRLQALLEKMSFAIRPEHLFTAPMAMHRYLREEGLRPHLLVHPDLREEFADLPQNDPDAVVLGYAREAFTYESLNAAFRLLMAGASLLATGRTRYFQDGEALSLDAGPFIAALEYAAATEAKVLGKPSADFFLAAAGEIGCRPEETVMIGDDAASDVGGAIQAGLLGILVRTGKYRPGDEGILEGRGEVAANAGEAVAKVLEQA